MRRTTRTSPLLVLALLASLLTFVSSGTAVAAESVPALKYPPVTFANGNNVFVTSPTGSVTVACSSSGDGLRTYNASGQLVQNISRTQTIDGVTNCITDPAVDKNGVVYGVPSGSSFGPNLLAYNGNTLKWKYPVSCGSTTGSDVAVGADGKIYATARYADGLHLIGLAPELESGQTQPAKVLDVKIVDDCSIVLFPYKDGILLRGQNSGFRFYNYAGNFLGQPSTVSNFWNAKVNGDGTLFDFKTVSGSVTSLSVSAYDPRKGAVAWTTTASTSGANVNFASLYPLPGGGLAALINEQKMVSDGVPATPTEYVYTLTVLNSSGQKVRSTQLPNKDANGNSYDAPRITIDPSGKIAMIRPVALSVTTSSGSVTTVPAISIGVTDAVTGSQTYGQVMTGDLSPSSPYGYFFRYGPFLTNDTLFLAASCSGNCTSTARKLYAVNVSGIGMDYPRGSVLTVPSPLKPYVALGDSFSSGQGAGIYDVDTVTDTNKCYKSYNGFGRILGRDTSSPLTLTNFAACGGSVTDNIDTNTTYPGVTQRQNQALSSNTKVVSLTIGGNDIGFADVVITCVKASVGLGDCDSAIADARQKLQILPAKLSRVYADILSKTSSQNGGANAQIYVLGYAPLLSASAPDCMVNDYPFGGDDKAAAIQLLSDLNKAISDTVGAINNSRIQYVNPGGANSPFMGHSLCTSEPYFNGIVGPDTSESFHPSTKGQKAYADLLAQYVLAS